MNEDEKYTTLDEYFAAHPEDEDGYYDDMAEIAAEEAEFDYPEDFAYYAREVYDADS